MCQHLTLFSQAALSFPALATDTPVYLLDSELYAYIYCTVYTYL